MRIRPAQADDHFYYKNGKLFMTHEPGSACLVAPGDLAWESDLRSLELLISGKSAPCTMEAVVAKYLVNQLRDG